LRPGSLLVKDLLLLSVAGLTELQIPGRVLLTPFTLGILVVSPTRRLAFFRLVTTVVTVLLTVRLCYLLPRRQVPNENHFLKTFPALL